MFFPSSLPTQTRTKTHATDLLHALDATAPDYGGRRPDHRCRSRRPAGARALKLRWRDAGALDSAAARLHRQRRPAGRVLQPQRAGGPLRLYSGSARRYRGSERQTESLLECVQRLLQLLRQRRGRRRLSHQAHRRRQGRLRHRRHTDRAVWTLERRVHVLPHGPRALRDNRRHCQPGRRRPERFAGESGARPADPRHGGHGDRLRGWELPGRARHPGTREDVEAWARHNGCATDGVATGTLDLDRGLDGLETEITRYTAGCKAGGSAELWAINGGGHGLAVSDHFSRLVVEWLLGHPKP